MQRSESGFWRRAGGHLRKWTAGCPCVEGQPSRPIRPTEGLMMGRQAGKVESVIAHGTVLQSAEVAFPFCNKEKILNACRLSTGSA